MHPKHSFEFFAGSIHLVYAVVAAQGFFFVSKIFIPIDKLYSFGGFEQGLSLIFVYYMLTTGWYGFFKSSKLFRHTSSRKGAARYGTGLLNTFILYYMITLTATDEGVKFEEIFWLIFVFYAVIFTAHCIKYSEYRKYSSIEEGPPYVPLLTFQIKFSAIFTFVIFLIVLLYDYCVINFTQFKWDDSSMWNVVFMFVIIGFVLLYREIMWIKEKPAEPTYESG